MNSREITQNRANTINFTQISPITSALHNYLIFPNRFKEPKSEADRLILKPLSQLLEIFSVCLITLFIIFH
jgi:hypothetical protein